jgi:hypothetical protein
MKFLSAKYSQKQITPLVLGFISVIELLLINEMSDLQPHLGNWAGKATEILNFDAPSDNLYGPGSALLLIPFIWNGPTFFVANVFYMFIGSIFFCKISQKIDNRKFRYSSYLSLILNPYFFWLCHSSQDTVFEFALLMLSLYFIINNKFIFFCLFAFLLSETRSQYWVFFLLAAVIKIFLSFRKKSKVKKVYFLPALLLFTVMGFNQHVYDSPSITLYAGETLELGQSRFFYIAHPKFDADFMLDLADNSGNYRKTKAPEQFSPAEKNEFYTKQAFQSMMEYPKQAVLNLMQKVDSTIFISQKVPNAPGYFKLNQDGNQIQIVDERLSWSLVLGLLLYQFWRGFMLILFISTVAILFYNIKWNKFKLQFNDFWLLLPWISTISVILLFYMETRYKLVPEMLLPVFSFLIMSSIIKHKIV